LQKRDILIEFLLADLSSFYLAIIIKKEEKSIVKGRTIKCLKAKE